MLQEGSHFGPYQLIKRIAFGGMAEIHLAKTTGLGGFEKVLALKVIHPKYSQDQEFIDMLIDEAKIAVQLSHVNVAQIFDLGRIDSTYYIAMEFIDGKDLYQLLVKCSELEIEIPLDIIAFIGMELAAGLAYAHGKSDNYGRPLNLIHRDVSPQNILISFDGEVKLVDFGIAKATQRSRETESGVIKGKFFYMSPEQAWGDAVDARTDVFSAGICLYEMVTGEMLYHEEKALVLLDKVRKAEIPNMRDRRPGLPPELEGLILRTLARDRDRRFQGAIELQTALSSFLYKNWPGFNRNRIAEFMRKVFGDQRFVLPMPTPGDPAETDTVPRKRVSPPEGNRPASPPLGSRGASLPPEGRGASPPLGSRGASPGGRAPSPPEPARAPPPVRPKAPAPRAPEPTSPVAPLKSLNETGSLDPLMRADDFVAQEHSVIFDLRSERTRNPAPSEDSDRTVAGAWYPGVTGEEEEEATIAQMVWEPSAPAGDDDDSTAVLDLDPRVVAARPDPEEQDELTSQYDRSPDASPAPPPPPPRPQRRTPAPPRPEPGPTRTLEAPSSLSASSPTTPARPVPAPARPAPPAPPAPAPDLPPPAPGPRARAANRAAEAGRPTMHASQAMRRPSAARRFGRWLATPSGITVAALVLLAGYALAKFLPTLLADRKPSLAVLVVDSVPRGAHVTLNGKETGQETPATLSDLSTGANHTVVLDLKGFEPHNEVVNISPDEAAKGEVRRKISLARATGTLHVRSEPVGAEVYLDGKYVGDTPITRRNLDRGKEQFLLLLRKDGFREQREVIAWDERVEIQLDVKLTKRGN